MDIQEILQRLEYCDGTFPREALTEAIAKGEQIIPDLLEIVKQAKENAEDLTEEENYMAHIYAMFLLAQFREKRAYPLIVDFFSLPGDVSDVLAGDVITEDLHRILASVSCGDDSLMKTLVENEDANEYVRGAALKGLVTLVMCEEKSRDEIIAYFQSLFRGKLKREFSQVWNGLVLCSTDLYPEEVFENIKQAYEEELVEPFFIDLEYIEKRLALGKEEVIARTIKDREYKLVEDTIKEMEWWACFKPKKQQREVFKPEQTREPVKKKIGRNEPCPCGSGKKYKKCCGR